MRSERDILRLIGEELTHGNEKFVAGGLGGTEPELYVYRVCLGLVGEIYAEGDFCGGVFQEVGLEEVVLFGRDFEDGDVDEVDFLVV